MPIVLAKAIFLPVRICTSEIRAFLPDLYSYSLLCISVPLPLIFTSSISARDTSPMAHVTSPVPFVNVALFIREFTFAVCIAQVPFAFVDSTICKSDFAFAMPEASEPLPSVCSTRLYVGVLAVIKEPLYLLYILFVKHRNFEFSLWAQGFSLVSDEKVRGLLSSLLLLFIKLYALNPAFDSRLDFDQMW